MADFWPHRPGGSYSGTSKTEVRLVTKIKLHIFVGTMTVLFGWYYLVDTLPRSRLIANYVAQAIAASQTGQPVRQPGFYVDNPVVSVRQGEDGRQEIVFSQASKRRCDQITSNEYVKQVAAQVIVGGGSCTAVNDVTLVIPPPSR